VHSVTDGRTDGDMDGQTDDTIMLIARSTACSNTIG